MRRRAHAGGSSAPARRLTPAIGAARNLLSPTERPVSPRSPAVDYQRHQPEQTLLYEVVRENLESFLANARERGAPVAHFVDRELRAYLDCGILARGFLRLHCDACGHDRLLAFSCKGRALCPSCGGRRMADTAAHLVDYVLPEVAVRQWVLTLPYPLRYRCAWDAKLTSEVLRAFLRALFADLRRRARHHHGVQSGHCGAVTAIQRFGSALNLTPHFHSMILDGVYPGPAHQPGPFLPLPPPTTEDVARVMAGTARRVMRLLEKRGLDNGDDPLAGDDPLLATLMAASVRSRIATGPEAGQPWLRLGDRVDLVEPREGGNDANAEAPARCVRQGGMSLHADVSVPARDRRRLERLCRYILRPPLALDRLEALPDGRLSYRLKTRWRDGTTHVLMERHELLERLAPLIPPPRAHQARYHGILAPCASGRDRVVPRVGQARASGATSAGGEGKLGVASAKDGAQTGQQLEAENGPTPRIRALEGAAIAGAECESHASRGAQEDRVPWPTKPVESLSAPSARRHRLPWADLLKRVFGIEALRCPCGKPMRVLAAITEPTVAQRILVCMGLSPRAPPLVPASSPDPAADFWLEEPAAADFDQTPLDDWGSGA